MSLKTRAITGVIFGAVMIVATGFSPLSCTILFNLICGLCLWELGGLILVQDSTSTVNAMRRGLLLAVGMLPMLFISAWTLDLLRWSVGAVSGFFVLLFVLFLFELFAKSSKPFENLAYYFLGLIYISIPFSLLMILCNKTPSGNLFVLAMLFMVWASDVFAYLLGSKIGKHKMFPRISPKKTWEGTLSGVAGAMLTGYICSLLMTGITLPLTTWLVVAAICTVFGILGDLVESMLKRSLGIKDSGTILPGHGGFLDRFDAFIFVVPFVFMAFILLK